MPSKEQASVQSVTVDTSSVPNLQDMSQIVNQNGYNTTCYGTYTTAKTTHACQPPPEKLAHLPYPETKCTSILNLMHLHMLHTHTNSHSVSLETRNQRES